MSDVFLSYSRRDQGVVRRLHGALADAGREAWVDWQGIPPTAEWMAEVRAAVDAADAFVVVLSPDWAALRCDLPPGPYHPSRFRPEVGFALGDQVFAFAHARGSIGFDPPGGEMALMSGAETRGYDGPDDLTSLGPTTADLVAYLGSIPLVSVRELPAVRVDGRPAVAVEVTTDAAGPVDLLFVDPLPMVVGPGEAIRIVGVDADGTWVAVLGSLTDAASATSWWTWFDAFIDGVRLPAGSAPPS